MIKTLLSKYKNFKKDKKGATAIEFAMIAPLLLFFTFGTLELSFYNYLRANVENHTHNAARIAITGFMPNNKDGLTREAYFKKLLKEELDLVSFQNFKPDFTSEVYADFNTSGKNIGNNTNRFGRQDQIVKITITANYVFVTPMLDLLKNQITQLNFETSVFIKNEVF